MVSWIFLLLRDLVSASKSYGISIV